MVARALEKRETERDASPVDKLPRSSLSMENGSGLLPPDPSKDPQWEGISGEMAKEFGEADPTSPATKGTHTKPGLVAAVDTPPIKLKVDTPQQPSLEEALSKMVVDEMSKDGATNATFDHLKKQMESLLSLLKQERDERLTTEAIVKDLSLDNRNLREELSKASLAAATSKAALDAREELLQHLKEEVVELRSVAFAKKAA